MPLGVYDHPAPDGPDSGVRSVVIPNDFGPFRLKEYGEGFYALTSARDWITGGIQDLMGL